MRKTIEHAITVAAPADRVFAVYADVANWHVWDPDTRSAHIDGPFERGARGALTPTVGRTVPMELTSVVPNRAFTAECAIPLFRMRFEHELEAVDGGTRVVHRAHFSGALAFLLGRVVGPRVDRGLPVTLERLKQLVETRAQAG